MLTDNICKKKSHDYIYITCNVMLNMYVCHICIKYTWDGRPGISEKILSTATQNYYIQFFIN